MQHQDCVQALPIAGGGSSELASSDVRRGRGNINAATGLATDYLNHFIEAIMLLEMLAGAPEFRDDFLNWQPVSYPEHFAASHFKGRGATIAAYEAADPHARACLEALTDTMTAVLEATRAALRADLDRKSVV